LEQGVAPFFMSTFSRRDFFTLYFTPANFKLELND